MATVSIDVGLTAALAELLNIDPAQINSIRPVAWQVDFTSLGGRAKTQRIDLTIS